MTNERELNPEELDQVSGGVQKRDGEYVSDEEAKKQRMYDDMEEKKGDA